MAEVLGGIVRLAFVTCVVVFKLGPGGQDKPFTFRQYYAQDTEYVTRRFKRNGKLFFGKKWLIWLMLVDTHLLSEVETIINDWDDERLESWAQNLLSSFGALAVAGSVLAAVNITALTLDGVSDINWTSRAAFAISLITSVLAVVFGTRLQRRLYLIGGPRELRSWLGKGARRPNAGSDAASLEIDAANLENDATDLENGGEEGQGSEEDRLESSIHAIRILQLPVELFAVSWLTFIVALILYTALMWRQHEDPGGDDYRNIMICLLLVLFMLVGYYEFARAMKDVEESNKEKGDVEASTGTSPSKPLDKGDDAVQQVLELARIGAASTQDILLRAEDDFNDCRDKDGDTPLMYAAEAGNLGQVLWLLRHGADPALGGNRAQVLAEGAGHRDVALVLHFNTPKEYRKGGRK